MKGFVYKTLYDEGIFIADSIMSAINAATCIGSAVLIGEAAYETNNYEINNIIFSFAANTQRKWEYLVQSNDDDINSDYIVTKFSAFSDDDYARRMLEDCYE